MRSSIFICLAILLVCISASADETYKDSLIQQFPFYKVAHGPFAPVYAATAKQIVQDFGITTGVCVDLGGAEGSLAIELAKITALKVYVLDIDPAAVRLCNLSADEAGLAGRVCAVEGDAQDVLFKDNFADLVISRNSMFEWPDILAGLKEAYRILKPGGIAYMGGGFSRLLDAQTTNQLVTWSKEKRDKNPDGWTEMDPEILTKARAAGIVCIRRIEGPTEFDWWLEIRK